MTALWLWLVSAVYAEQVTPKVTKVITTRQLELHEELYNKAANAMNDGDPKACMKHLAETDSKHLHSEQFLSLGYICAIAASHLDAADMLRTELGLEYMPPSSLDIHHAWMLRREGKSQEALNVLTPEGWTSQKHKELGTTMQAVLYTDLEQWTEAWLLAGSPYVEQKCAALHRSAASTEWTHIEIKIALRQGLPSSAKCPANGVRINPYNPDKDKITVHSL